MSHFGKAFRNSMLTAIVIWLILMLVVAMLLKAV
jgi:hypothetical protein